MTLGLLLALSLGSEPSLVPPLILAVPSAVGALDLSPAPAPATRSGWGALGLSLACELPTAFFGPSCGHLYAGEEAHFFTTGGLRVADLLALVALDRLGFGTPPLYAVIQPHFSRSAAAWPLAYPLDFVLVALWWGTGLYDLIDSVFAAKRHNHRAEVMRAMAARPLEPSRAEPPLAMIRF
jgi:hypothetical protein